MVIKMIRKIVLTIIISCVLGSVTGILLHNKFSDDVFAFSEGYQLYFLREGVYSNKEIMEENTKKLDPKLVLKEDGKYYVYVGITSNEKIVEKIKKIYSDMDIDIYKKEKGVDDENFVSNVKQFDSMILSSDKDEMLSIEEVVLSNYEEVFGTGV